MHIVLVKFTANKSIKDCDRKLGDIKKHIQCLKSISQTAVVQWDILGDMVRV